MSDSLDRVTERALAHAGGSRFTLVAAVVERTHQLAAGWPPLVTGVAIDKPATTAIREIAAAAVDVEPSRPRSGPKPLQNREAA